MAFKMKGHELPGPHQRKSPAKQNIFSDKQDTKSPKPWYDTEFKNLKKGHKGIDERVYDVDQDKYDKWRKDSDAPDIRYLGAKKNKKYLDAYKSREKTADESPAKVHPTEESIKKETDLISKKSFRSREDIEAEVRRKRQEATDESFKTTPKQDKNTERILAAREKRTGSRELKSPAKIAPLVMMGAQMLGKKMMEKKQEEGSPATSPAKGRLTDALKKGASKVKKHLRKKWDKTTQVGEGFKESLYADSDYTGAGTNIIDSFKKGYRREKLADEKAAKRKANTAKEKGSKGRKLDLTLE